jgi:hypothetical protein
MSAELYTAKNVTAEPISEGDAGIILKPNGEFQIFNCHDNIDPNNMTDVQKEQGMKLIALATALKYPQLIGMLIEFADQNTTQGNASKMN